MLISAAMVAEDKEISTSKSKKRKAKIDFTQFVVRAIRSAHEAHSNSLKRIWSSGTPSYRCIPSVRGVIWAVGQAPGSDNGSDSQTRYSLTSSAGALAPIVSKLVRIFDEIVSIHV